MWKCNLSAECAKANKCEHGKPHDCDEPNENIYCDTVGCDVVCEHIESELKKVHLPDVIPVDSDLTCGGCKWDGLQLGMRSPCDLCKRFHNHHKDLYVKNQ